MRLRIRCSDVHGNAVAAACGFSVTRFDQIGSTNDAGMDHLKAGGAGDHWFVADEQTGGRGRLGRTWSSPRGNLYASLALRNPCAIESGFQLGFVAALSIFEAVAACGVAREELSLKWPNDVLLRGAKLSGILVEGGLLSDGTFVAVIGCGLNLVSHPDLTLYRATDILENGIAVSTDEAFGSLSGHFKNMLERFDGGRGFGVIRKDWIERARGIGDPISVRQTNEVMEGIFHGLDEQGRLLLKRGGEIFPLVAGDVSF